MHRVILATIPPKHRFIQLGIYNLKAYAQKYDSLRRKVIIDINLINPKYIFAHGSYWPFLDNDAILFIAKSLLKTNPNIIGFSCFSWNLNITLKLSSVLKKLNPNVIIIFGGPEVSVDSENLLTKEISMDMIVRDEGEATFSDILRSVFLKELSLADIKGLAFKFGNRIIKNPDRESLNLEEIPSPYLNKLINISDDVVLVVETSRGCSFRCAYCSYSIQSNQFLRFFPIGKVKKEFEYLLKSDVKRIWINDDNFNIHPSRATEILSHIRKYKKNTFLHAYINASIWKIDNQLINLFRKTNLKCIVGVQSINKKTLLIINRLCKQPILEANLRNFDKNKLSYSLQFIGALPNDTYQDIKRAIDWAGRFKADRIDFFLLELMKGTQLYDNAKLLGLKTDNKRFPSLNFVTETKDMNKKDVSKLIVLGNAINLIYNKKFLRKTIRYLIENHLMKLSDIAEEWGKEINLFIIDLKYIKLIQRSFVNHLLSKYKLKIAEKKINQLLSDDINIFISTYSDL